MAQRVPRGGKSLGGAGGKGGGLMGHGHKDDISTKSGNVVQGLNPVYVLLPRKIRFSLLDSRLHKFTEFLETERQI